MAADETRIFPIGGICGVGQSAVAIAANVTVVNPQGAGFLTLFAGDVVQPPSTSNLNFSAGQTRANNAVLPLALGSAGTVKVHASLTQGTTDVLLDVNGYFE